MDRERVNGHNHIFVYFYNMQNELDGAMILMGIWLIDEQNIYSQAYRDSRKKLKRQV